MFQGTGKSSTIAKCTGRNVVSGGGSNRVTVTCSIYTEKEPLDAENNDNKAKPVWVDTVGWDDVDLSDDGTLKDILRFINENRLTRVQVG